MKYPRMTPAVNTVPPASALLTSAGVTPDNSENIHINTQRYPELSPVSVEKSGDKRKEADFPRAAAEEVTPVTFSPETGDATPAWSGPELDTACALWPGQLHPDAVPSEVLQWARKKVKRGDKDLTGWLRALRQVPCVYFQGGPQCRAAGPL